MCVAGVVGLLGSARRVGFIVVVVVVVAGRPWYALASGDSQGRSAWPPAHVAIVRLIKAIKAN